MAVPKKRRSKLVVKLNKLNNLKKKNKLLILKNKIINSNKINL